MGKKRTGRRLGIPHQRRLTCDLLWFNRSVPLCGHDRIFRLSELAEFRAETPRRISWSALFIRAFGLVAQQCPELRQTWYRWPVSHLYQHPVNVATLTVHRRWRDEPWLFWGQISEPESLTLEVIQQHIDRFRDDPVTRVFRKQTKLARLPTVLRRLIWWWNIHIATARRADRLGTFFVSTLSGKKTEIQIPPSIHTGCLTFGPVDRNGDCRVTLAYDHRVMDGSFVADVLELLETIMTRQMPAELKQIPTAEQFDDQIVSS